MRLIHTILLGLLTAPLCLPQAAWALQASAESAPPIAARIWMDRGVDPVLQSGDRARVYYRASVDAYMVLFHVNTDGVVRLLFPGGTEDPSRVRGGRDYRLLFPDGDHWEIQEPPGVGYFFVLASSQPFEFDRLSDVRVPGGWASTPERNRVHQDPYVTVDQFREALLPEGSAAGYAIDFTAYHVGQPYSYPRFLCYQCHDEQSFERWDPYRTACHEVRVVIYNDPYFYPATRYQGGRVLFARPPEPGLPQFTFKARGIGETGAPLVQSRYTDAPRSVEGPSGVPSDAPDTVPGQVAQDGSDTGFPIPISGRLGGTLGLEPVTPGNPLAPPADAARSRPVVESPGSEVRSRPVLRRRPADDDGTGPR
ncbi:MAG: DUF4384 domain-containing protein [Gemmatimonadota bacterium]